MKKIDLCPVTHVSLFMMLRDLERGGVLTLSELFRPGFGLAQRYMLDGQSVQFKIGYTGPTDWLDVGESMPGYVSEPHDIAYVGRTLIANSKTL